jgi:hypothetical protein
MTRSACCALLEAPAAARRRSARSPVQASSSQRFQAGLDDSQQPQAVGEACRGHPQLLNSNSSSGPAAAVNKYSTPSRVPNDTPSRAAIGWAARIGLHSGRLQLRSLVRCGPAIAAAGRGGRGEIEFLADHRCRPIRAYRQPASRRELTPALRRRLGARSEETRPRRLLSLDPPED